VGLYTLAVGRLAPGPLRAEAAYWLGALHPDPVEGITAWTLAAGTPRGGAWSRLAATEIEMAELRSHVGRSPQGDDSEVADAPPASAGGAR
jgi:hypothetical protein